MPRRGIDLTEDQWARVKSHAATRRQTISQFVSDVVDEILPDGHIRPATRAISGTKSRDNINTIAGPLLDPSVEASVRLPPQPRPPAMPSRPFTPAPKPSQIKGRPPKM